jgi:hypothetical protein
MRRSRCGRGQDLRITEITPFILFHTYQYTYCVVGTSGQAVVLRLEAESAAAVETARAEWRR